MKCIVFLFIFISTFSFSQDEKSTSSISKKGSFYVFWGWNRDLYSKSDIMFRGNDYNFTLDNVVAKDRQSPFEFEVYLNPNKITIPQYNFRVGYYFNDKYEISVGVDHMKYVMQNDQQAEITGTIANSGTSYDGTYDHESIKLTKDFLMFEHTDGLNYFNAEVRRSDHLYSKSIFDISFQAGGGAGLLVPRTNTTLLGNPRYDQFHVSGFGINATTAIKVDFWDRFFLQTEFKGGFINMPSIRTTMFESDLAKQHFWFLETNIVLGANLNIKKK